MLAPITLEIPDEYLNTSVFLDSYTSLNHELDLLGLNEKINNVSSTALKCVEKKMLRACDVDFDFVNFGKINIAYKHLHSNDM